MFWWRSLHSDVWAHSLITTARAKHTYPQRYEKILMRWGSGLFWAYTLQCVFGVLLSLEYTLLFDTGMLTVIHIWWETSYGSFLIRLHSEVANLLFFILYCHVFTKLWTSLDSTDADSYVSWISGTVIFILTYVAGVTGAIMPCSTLSEVTATIVGSMLTSLVYVKFDFLETLMVPGLSLNEASIWRTFVVHAIAPLAGLALGLIHMVTLHTHKYTAGGGFKRMNILPRFRETRRWSYANRYWLRACGTWLRMLLLFMIIKFANELFKQTPMVVSYGFSNLDYWPINENIDFVLTIPHWYLRPLMGALVAIPHHYLGFIYIGIFFVLIILGPWAFERSDDNIWEELDNSDKEGWTTPRWDLNHFFLASSFFFGAMFTTAIVPTGKYFIALGSMDGLIYSYWILLLYIFTLAQSAFFLFRLNWSTLNI